MINKNDISLGLQLWLAADDYDFHSPPEKTISVTSLLKPIKQIILLSRMSQDITIDKPVFSSVSARVGQSVHSSIENCWLDEEVRNKALKALQYPKRVRDNISINPETPGKGINVYLENRAEKKIKGWTVSGKFDFVIDGVVEDFKTTKTFIYSNSISDDKFAKQGSLYKWLNPDIITADYMNINYIFTDWMANRAATDKSYPKEAAITQPYVLATTQETQKFIETKLTLIEKNWNKLEEDLPPCTDEDLWRTEDVYQYWSKPENKKASNNYKTRREAEIQLVNKGKGFIKVKKGEVKACKFCDAFAICEQKNEYLSNGDLKI